MPEDEVVSIPELALDPVWSWRMIGWEGRQLPVLTLHHPRHGQLHMLLGRETAALLGKWLTEVGTPPGETAVH